jgi:pantoate--beta-alanine ligase
MILFKEAKALKKYIALQKKRNSKFGYVPTMGALHAGHISLIEASKNQTDITVCSIFINPTQFNDPKDFEKYPVTISTDILLLERCGCDVLFLPPVKEIYPEGIVTSVDYDLGTLENILEGKYRPGHFKGVSQVVHKLLEIVKPDYLFLGQKDYQQCLVIKQLINQLTLPVEVITVNTLRGPSGLAMSSRNLRLSPEEKEKAGAIFTMLTYIKAHYNPASAKDLENYAREYLLQHGFTKVDYVSIADAETLQHVANTGSGKKAIALIAAFIGEVRLIDNMMLTA